MTTKKKAAGLRNRAAFKNSNESSPNHTARRGGRQRLTTADRYRVLYDPRAEYEKAIAKQQRLKGAIVHAYNVGAISIDMCGAVFARCPHWGPL